MLSRLMSSNVLFSSNIPPSTKTSHFHSASFLANIKNTPQCINFNRRDIALPVYVSSSVSQPEPEPEPGPSFNVGYLESEFGSDGVSFKGIGQSYVIKMVLENGSAASLMMPSGLITSYKPKMWHGSSTEVLHTSVSESPYGDPIIQGGVSLLLIIFDDEGFSWSPDVWLLNDVHGSPEESIQVEMICRDINNTVEVKHNMTLKDDTLKSQINISTSKNLQLKMRGSIISHLNVSTPEATYAFGLEGSNFADREPINSKFCIIPPNTSGSSQMWSMKDFFSSKKDEGEIQEETEGEEDDNYKHLTGKMSRIYTFAPRSFTIIDRGKRNSVNVGRKGFEEVYMYSPGSAHESYGEYSYVCVGQSALLKPVSLGHQQMWTGEQLLHNPNL